jgi:hypothetical protein
MLNDNIPLGGKMDLSEIEKQLKNHEERITKLEVKMLEFRPSTNNEFSKGLSIKEFILEKKPDGMYQMGLAIAYYFEKYKKFPFFTREELADGFKQAREPIPSNLSAVIYKNAERGYFMDANEKKNNKNAWMLTNSGEKLVEDCFQKTDKK